jgi:hypothetical protein
MLEATGLAVGSLGMVRDTVRRLPTGVFVGLAVVLLGLGGIWWTRTAPAAATQTTPPIRRLVTVRLDDGRVLTYRTGRTSISDPTNPQRRHCRRTPTRYPDMRIVGQDAPPVYLTRCG